MKLEYLIIAFLIIFNIITIILSSRKRKADKNELWREVELNFEEQKHDIKVLEKYLHELFDDYYKHIKRLH